MSAVLYCSKVNLTSQQLFQVYEDESLLHKILSILHGDISSDTVYEEDDSFLNENDEIITRTIRYRLSISEKTDYYVHGYLCKDSVLYYKTFNEMIKEPVMHSTPYTESVQFYFDVYKELIVFHTTTRMGYREFNEAMSGILNKTLEDNNRDFRFEVSLMTEGLAIEDIESELKKIDNIYELHFQYQPPNPDNETIRRWQENGEKLLDDMENANATRVSQVFKTSGGRGLNLDSEMIKQSLDNIRGVSRLAGDTNAVAKGYVSVDAVDAHGKKYTTQQSKPIKTVVNSLDNFVVQCKRVISSLR